VSDERPETLRVEDASDEAHSSSMAGTKDGNPNALFDTAGYLATYGDVKVAGINPLDHFLHFGI